MLEQQQDIQAKAIELRKAVQCQWIFMIATSLFMVVTIGIFFFAALSNFQTVVPIILVDVICTWRTLSIKQAAQEMRNELVQIQQDATTTHSGAWPLPPRKPMV